LQADTVLGKLGAIIGHNPYVALYGETWTIVIDMYYEATLK